MPWSPLPTPDGPGGARPAPLADGLDRVLAALGSAPVDALTTVRDRWSEIVGPQAAEALDPVGIEGGRIVAVTTSPQWASQAPWLESGVVERAAALLGEGVVDGLVVRVARR